jgi:predicted RNase H-like HicB family nuclease
MTMRRVTVIYHWEPEGCWAESPEVPGFSAAAPTIEDLRGEVQGGLEFHFGEPSHLVELLAEQEPGWSMTFEPAAVEASSPLWRQIAAYGTEVAGALKSRSLSTSSRELKVRSAVAYAGQ